MIESRTFNKLGLRQKGRHGFKNGLSLVTSQQDHCFDAQFVSGGETSNFFQRQCCLTQLGNNMDIDTADRESKKLIRPPPGVVRRPIRMTWLVLVWQ